MTTPPPTVSPARERAPGGRRGWLLNAAFGLGFAVVLLLLLELVLRLTGVVPADQLQGAPLGTWARQPGLYEPDQRVHDTNQPRLPFTATTDALGFRTAGDLARERAGAFRILCLGDSYTFGAGVDDEETWPFRLQEVLDRVPGDPTTQVYNAGVPGFTITDERMLLEKALPLLPVDAVLLEFTQNDLSDLTKKVPNFVQMEKNARLKSMPVLGPGIRLLLESAIVIGLQRALARYDKARGDHDAIPRVPTLEALTGAESAALWSQYEQELSGLRDSLRESGVRLGVINFPSEFQLHEPDPGGSPLGEIAGRLGVPYLDLTPAMREARERGENLYLLPIDQHPSAAGYAVAGEVIGAWVRGSWLAGNTAP